MKVTLPTENRIGSPFPSGEQQHKKDEIRKRSDFRSTFSGILKRLTHKFNSFNANGIFSMHRRMGASNWPCMCPSVQSSAKSADFYVIGFVLGFSVSFACFSAFSSSAF